MAALPATSLVAEDPFQTTACSVKGAPPVGYAAPLVSNGSLCMLIDYQGSQFQRSYAKMTPSIWWEGRRYGPAHNEMVPFGHFEQELSVAGKACKAPTNWTQTLNAKEAVVTCRNEYGDDLTVETTVFTHLAHDLVVVKKRLAAKSPSVRSAHLTFKYQFTPPGTENRLPRRTMCTPSLSNGSQSVDFRYQIDGQRPFDGIILVFSDKPVAAAIDRQAVALSADVPIDASKPAEMTFFLLFADSMDGKDYLDRAARLKSRVRQEGFDGLLASHRQEWAKYWDESYVRLPVECLERAYCTAQYHLRANATKWSFPVGVFPTHWAGKFFGWDEMFCYQALISSNHRDIARRCPEFRLATMQHAINRASHYGKPGVFGARYPWETLEDGTEGAPPGYWMEHVFHMSNIALSAWFQYLYTADKEYLSKTGYPVIKECARFFLGNMVYQTPDGGMFLGKCTDLERLGPARQNPFMTSCGAIYTMEAAARAAALLNADETEAAAWKHAAAKLRESLPRDGNQYIPYPGCTERSIAVLGGIFPYPVLNESDPLQRNAVLDFVAKGRASGNMYPVGNAVCPWYAGWMAAALAVLGEKVEPAKLLSEAADSTGCFGELFEINEAAVSMRPWFATASGNIVYAVNQMLVQSRGEEIRLAHGVPEGWKEYGFKLACHGNLAVEAGVKNGRLVKLRLLPGDKEVEYQRTLVIPSTLIDAQTLNKSAVVSVAETNGSQRIAIRFKGQTDIFGEAQK